MCLVAPEDAQLPLILSCWCSIDLVINFFLVSPLYADPHEHFNSYAPGYLQIVKYGQEEVLKRDNSNFVKTNAWKPLFRKMKTLH